MDGDHRKTQIFEQMGGRAQIDKVTKCFYDKVYEHEWLSKYFVHVPREHIENQQSSFMQGALGGPNRYSGRMITTVHPHMNINEELFDIRERLLKEALEECHTSQEMSDKWLHIDEKFRKNIVKKNLDECEPRFQGDKLIDIPKPPNFH